MALPCTKKPRTQEDAEQTAAMLTLKNKLEGLGMAYAYACNLCRPKAPNHWHVTSQPYHLIAKAREASENPPPTLPCHAKPGLDEPGPAVPRLDQPGQELKTTASEEVNGQRR